MAWSEQIFQRRGPECRVRQPCKYRGNHFPSRGKNRRKDHEVGIYGRFKEQVMVLCVKGRAEEEDEEVHGGQTSC